MNLAARKAFATAANRAMMRPLLQKTAAGFSSPIDHAAKAAIPHRSAAFSLRLQFYGGSAGGRKPCRFNAPRGPGLLTRSSRHPRLAAGVSVFANLTSLECHHG